METNNMAQQRKIGNSDKSMTAVEWLVKILIEMGELDEDTNLDSILIASAKQMEKEQIINAHISGYDSSGGSAIDYYNNVYGIK